jgi:hypothetical protein
MQNAGYRIQDSGSRIQDLAPHVLPRQDPEFNPEFDGNCGTENAMVVFFSFVDARYSS